MAVLAPPLPELGSELAALARKIADLTVEMREGKEADDWGRVVAAENERRPLIHDLIQQGFVSQGGEMAQNWLRWLLKSDEEVMARGAEVRNEIQKVRVRNASGERAIRAYYNNEKHD